MVHSDFLNRIVQALQAQLRVRWALDFAPWQQQTTLADCEVHI